MKRMKKTNGYKKNKRSRNGVKNDYKSVMFLQLEVMCWSVCMRILLVWVGVVWEGLKELAGAYVKNCRSHTPFRKTDAFVMNVTDIHNSKFEWAGVCYSFRMNVREVHTNALERQLTESVKIENIKTPSMNRKSGYDVNRTLGRWNDCCLQ